MALASIKIFSNSLTLTTGIVGLMLVTWPLVEGFEQPLGIVHTSFQSFDCAEIPDEYLSAKPRAQIHDVSEIQCVRKCVSDPDCSFCSLNSTRMCSIFSAEIEDLATAYGSDLNKNSGTQNNKCKVFFINRCENGGILRNGICKCMNGYTGQNCDITNEDYCQREWSVFLDLSSSETPIFGQLPEESVKVGFDDPDTGARMFIKSTQATTRKSDPYYNIQTMFTMEKKTWDSYEDEPRRLFRLFASNGKRYALKVSRDFFESKSTVSFETVFIAPKITPYQTQCSNSYTDILSQVKLGHGIKNEGFLVVDDKFNIISDQVSRVQLGANSGYLSPRYYWCYSLTIDQKTKLTKRCIVRTFVRSPDVRNVKTLNENLGLWDFTPCWVPVDFDRFTGENIRITKLQAYLKNGHNVRVVIDGIMSTHVLEVLQEGQNLTFVLISKLSSLGPHDLSTRAVRPILSPELIYTECIQEGDSDIIIEKNFTQVTDVKWFVDSRSWTKVFAVYSNSSVHYGNAEDLSEAVKTGSDVRIWIQFLDSNYSRYMDVYANSVQSKTLVSSESYVTWRLDDCLSETVLVTTEGKMQIAKVAYGPGDTNMPPLPLVTNVYNVLIAWFVA